MTDAVHIGGSKVKIGKGSVALQISFVKSAL